ncbi:glycosyltransferase family 2 protein [Robertkochia sediminum]|uniref:glycosyltransferase family 2 protein n=1 Tax=Robertkochia sediminum TaxID=2785326 RepID=UPI00293D824E|nr:glycosyltransferase family 2 protein [Robertkochia sediminum]
MLKETKKHSSLTYSVVIPAHNEEAFLALTLDSLLSQSVLPEQIVVVNDHSTDSTPKILKDYQKASDRLTVVHRRSESKHMPGSKVVATFNAGLDHLNKGHDIIVKLDADLILPSDYFEKVLNVFEQNPKAGIVGGFAWEQEGNGEWKRNHPMNKDHVRGAFKSYSTPCFEAIGGLRPAMGWDTIDELLARYNGYEIITLPELKVKHLRPTGGSYNKKARLLQGEAMFLMRYGLPITLIASAKMAFKQKKVMTFFHNIQGYFRAQIKNLPPAVTPEEGRFIRAFRWKGIKAQLPF